VVVFVTHFACGFGLSTSGFFRSLVDKYRLQPHHLPANAYTVLSSFVAFTEGYLSLWPNIELWARHHNLRTQSVQDKSIPPPYKTMVTCGAAMVMPRRSTKFIRVNSLESCCKWQKTFFYVKNAGTEDFINLPPYVKSTSEKHNWTYNMGNSHVETNQIYNLICDMHESGLPSPDDLVRTFITRRISPIQRHSHKICQMSGCQDPTRMTTFELDKPEVLAQVKAIAQTTMEPDWEWDLELYSRAHPAPHVT
jgi:hypothetical protein